MSNSFLSKTLLRVATITFTTFVSVSAFAQSVVSIGYVDLQQALNTVDDGVSAREELEESFEDRQEEIDRAQTELEQYAQDLEAGFAAMNEEARVEAAQDYQQRVMALQQMFQEHQVELAQAEAEATSGIFEDMLEIVSEIAQERNYTLVLERTESSVLYATEEMNFTDELISRYNDAH